MIAMLSHDHRFPSATAPVKGSPRSISSAFPDAVGALPPATVSFSSSPVLTCQPIRNSSAGALDSTELSAAHALLNLTPTSFFRGSNHAPVGRVLTSSWCRDKDDAPTSSVSAPAIVVGSGTRPTASQTSPPPFLPRTIPSEIVTSDSVSSDESNSSDEEASFYGTYYSKFYDGTTSLALDTDEDFLSPLHCFMRRFCVEAFSATNEDAVEPRHGGSHYVNHGRVVAGQVGIRCLHCKHRPVYERAERAVCFPSSLKNIYHSIETWQRRHSLVCQDIPDWVKREMTGLIQSSKSCAGGRRGYWEESAARIGLADTSSGIRFVRSPGDVGAVTEVSSLVTKNESRHPVVEPGDQALVTDYLFLLLDQMETCQFTEEDRAGGRSKVKSCPVGFPGMQCKHCAGKAGFGRYFPANLSALTSANSDRNIFNHIQKCRRCPVDVKQDLLRLRDEYQRHKNRRGSRKVFFQRVWNRLHN